MKVEVLGTSAKKAGSSRGQPPSGPNRHPLRSSVHLPGAYRGLQSQQWPLSGGIRSLETLSLAPRSEMKASKSATFIAAAAEIFLCGAFALAGKLSFTGSEDTNALGVAVFLFHFAVRARRSMEGMARPVPMAPTVNMTRSMFCTALMSV